MILKKLQLKHFRNYADLSIDFNKKINIFVGNNAQGKTNILESIYVLAIARSHRTTDDSILIQKEAKFTKIKGVIRKKNDSIDKNLEILLNSRGKKVSINQKPIRKISDYISYFTVVAFHPDNLDIIKGSPGERRKFLNIEIGQMHNHYLALLSDYHLVLKNRNEYLKRITIEHYDEKYLEIITEQLVDIAIKIYKYRTDFFDQINKKIDEVNEKIKGPIKLKLKYITSLPICEEPELKKNLINKYKSLLSREIFMAQTMMGPHRDDFVFLSEEKDIRNFGSQGQQRISVLCLKLAETELLKEITGEYPVLLLDDIFSELDNCKKHNIIKYLSKKMQIIITTTDVNEIDKKMLINADIFIVDKANVTKQNQKKKKVEVK